MGFKIIGCKIFMTKKFFIMLIFLSGVATSQALTPLTVMLDWLPNPDQAPLFIAEEAGIFARHGLAVTLINPADASDPLKMVAVGKVDIGLTYQPSWLLAQTQGLPLVWIANLIDQPLACVIADSSITQLKDLNNKTIGYSSGAVDSIVLATILKNSGMALKDVHLINVHYNLNQALLSHRVEAVSGAMRNVELIELKAQGLAVNAFYPEQQGVPPYAELIFVAHQATTPALKAFVAALKEAIVYLKAHPTDSWQLLIKHHAELNTPINQQIFQVTIPYFTDHADYFDSKQNERLAKFLRNT